MIAFDRSTGVARIDWIRYGLHADWFAILLAVCWPIGFVAMVFVLFLN